MSAVASNQRRHRLGVWVRNVLVSAVLVAIGLVIIAPIYWTIETSFLPLNRAYVLPPPIFPPTMTLSNYRAVFDGIPYGVMIFNSIKLSTIITFGILVISTLAAYAFTWLHFPGRDLLFVLFLAGLMIPFQMTVVPLFVILRNFNLIDTHEAVYLPAFFNAFSIFLLRQSFLSLPKELVDAAIVDGASHLQILLRIILPNSVPALAGVAVLQFQYYFNDFFWPLVVLQTQGKWTIPLGLVSLHGLFQTAPSTAILAGIVTVLIPLVIVFVLGQRFITETFARSGLKV